MNRSEARVAAEALFSKRHVRKEPAGSLMARSVVDSRIDANKARLRHLRLARDEAAASDAGGAQ
jgi:hypothetical protein